MKLAYFLLYIFMPPTAHAIDTSEITNYLSGCAERLDSHRQVRRYPPNIPASDFVSFNNDTNTFTVLLKIHFRLEQFHHSYKSIVPQIPEIMRQALDGASEFYKQFGINLQIELTFDLAILSYQPSPVPRDAHLVYLRPHRGDTMNVLRWGLNPEWELQPRTMIYTHELTHMFGLLDEYERKALQSPFVGEEDSLMKNWDHPQARLYLRHIQHILNPLCNK